MVNFQLPATVQRYTPLIATCRRPGMKKSVSPFRYPIIWVNEQEFYIGQFSRVNKNGRRFIWVVCEMAGEALGTEVAFVINKVIKDFMRGYFTRVTNKPGNICTSCFACGVRVTCSVRAIQNNSSKLRCPAFLLLQTLYFLLFVLHMLRFV